MGFNWVPHWHAVPPGKNLHLHNAPFKYNTKTRGCHSIIHEYLYFLQSCYYDSCNKYQYKFFILKTSGYFSYFKKRNTDRGTC